MSSLIAIFNKVKIGITILVLLQACNTTSVKEETDASSFEDDTLSFMKRISGIPDIKLPYTMHCGIDCYMASFPVADDFGFIRTVPEPEVSIIVGKLPIHNDKVYILYGLVGDIIYPLLNIYDKKGNWLDSLYLHISWCDGDCEIVKTPTTTINKDFSIHMVDTTQYFNCIENDEGDDRILDSIIVNTRKMNLTKDGYYKVIKETTSKIE
jgi:hypothetical protein